jgi:hypothetical protein
MDTTSPYISYRCPLRNSTDNFTKEITMKITFRAFVFASFYVAQTTLAVGPFNDTSPGTGGSECGT